MDLRVERLTPTRGADYLRYFDHERGPAFADNPGWRTCYCHYHEVSPALSWEAFDGPMNRTAVAARIAAGEMEGYLAYDGGDVVGWMNAQPYHRLPHACARMRIARPDLPVPPHDAAAIVCFVIHPAHRRRGVARALLAGGVADLAARGLALVDAFPRTARPGATGPADHYHGTLSMFLAAGFVPLARHENATVVRRTLR